MDESKLCQLFSIYGIITSCKIQTDNNGQSRGFGFVDFERAEMAKNAMEKLNGYLLDNGKHLYVGPFQRKSERQNELQRIQEENFNETSNNLRLYISNLDTIIDEKMLEEIFSEFGRVTKTYILRNGNQSKGIGFVSFNRIEETTKALNEMNGKWILSKPIYVKLSKDNNNAQLTTSNTTEPSTSSQNITYPTITPMPYYNIPPIFYLPTIMIPPPLNLQVPTIGEYSLALPPPSAEVTTIGEYSIPRPPPSAEVTTIRDYSSPTPPPSMITTSTTTHLKRQVYPYVRVKADDQ